MKWRRLHLLILSRDYEYFIDMRKFCKRSVSFLIAMAVDRYLDDIINKMNNNDYGEIIADNCQFSQYIQQIDHLDGAIRWSIYWGIPWDKRQLFRKNRSRRRKK